ncbi:ABC transporter permease [Microbacterium gorillae]|uniref:ABC transporter permease n=1 Tax=Microbacterium gorillae TaxID=1231063 RepID=UPI0006936181|nr:ABC transporter permease [Microbacterium gorillae]
MLSIEVEEPVALVEIETADATAARAAGPYRWIGRRLGLGVVTLVLVAVIVFFVTMLLPGDAARVVLGNAATPERLTALRAEMGLDRPIIVQFASWVGGILRGDFGDSLVSRRPVTDIVLPALGNTLALVTAVVAISIPLALVIGIAAAVRPGGIMDGFVGFISVVISALPEFVIAIVLIVALSTGALALFPAVSLIPVGDSPFAHPDMMFLPALTLIIISIPYLALQVRASLQDSLRSEYVTMAELKGLSRPRVLLWHALPNSLAPAIQAAGLTLTMLMGGTVVLEFIFQYPGIGLALSTAVAQRDITTVQAAVVILAAGYIVINLVADVLTLLVTPKLRTR